jgi:AmmeMemoRadiSam system protein B
MLARLRPTLDFMPSPLDDKPGLLIRDPFQFSQATLIIPPALIEFLEFYDGKRSALDLRAELVRVSGDVQTGQIEEQLTGALSQAGFLEDEHFEKLRAAAEQAFGEAPVRFAAHAGSGYPDERGELAQTISSYLAGSEASPVATPAVATPAANPETTTDRVLAIAAPHVSPFGGIDAYRAAYSALSPADAERTFVILGTSHYGYPDRLGLTRKPFETHFGSALTDVALVEKLAAQVGNAAQLEDYCHAIEHSIEFQVVFLQHLFGPRIRILPILCGTYSGLYQGALPEHADAAQRIFGALGEMAAREGDRLLWVLGVDMAHMGRRYGDSMRALAGRNEMQDVEARDRARIERMEAGDARGFWDLVRDNGDDLKWCGSSPIYTFLKAVPGARGKLRHYQQWNIDPESVVSFAGMSFHPRE